MGLVPFTELTACTSSVSHFTMVADGEGNGNPLQYSCLENPMDKEAW